MTGAIKSKLTGTTPSDDETRAARGDDENPGKTTVKIDVKDTRAGQVATSLKASDQMTGQAFNDVGEMDEDARKGRVTVEEKGRL